jgi:hypothetical protein
VAVAAVVVAVLVAAPNIDALDEEVMIFDNDDIAKADCCWKRRRHVHDMMRIGVKWKPLLLDGEVGAAGWARGGC